MFTGHRCNRLGCIKENRSHPIYAEQGAGLAENSNDLLYLAVAYSLTDTAKHHQCSWLQRWVVLECKPGIQKCSHIFIPKTDVGSTNALK